MLLGGNYKDHELRITKSKSVNKLVNYTKQNKNWLKENSKLITGKCVESETQK